MGKIYPLTENVINHVIGVTRAEYKKINWHNAELNVRPLLDFNTFTNTVRQIINDCCSSDGRFLPEFFDFSLRANIVAAYGYVELPEDFDRLYEVLYVSDLYDSICKAVNGAQLEALKQAAMSSMRMM